MLVGIHDVDRGETEGSPISDGEENGVDDEDEEDGARGGTPPDSPLGNMTLDFDGQFDSEREIYAVKCADGKSCFSICRYLVLPTSTN